MTSDRSDDFLVILRGYYRERRLHDNLKALIPLFVEHAESVLHLATPDCCACCSHVREQHEALKANYVALRKEQIQNESEILKVSQALTSEDLIQFLRQLAKAN